LEISLQGKTLEDISKGTSAEKVLFACFIGLEDVLGVGKVDITYLSVGSVEFLSLVVFVFRFHSSYNSFFNKFKFFINLEKR